MTWNELTVQDTKEANNNKLNKIAQDVHAIFASLLMVFLRLLGVTGTAAALFGRSDLLNRLG